MKVTKKQDLFCRRYLIDFNATKAAIAIGYSKKTARQIGCQLLTKVNVAEHLEKLRKEMEGKLDTTRERMLQELGAIAYSDLSNLKDKDGSFKPLHSLAEEDRAAIAGIEVDELFDFVAGKKVKTGVTRKIKLWDKLKAIDILARVHGYAPTMKVSATDDKGNAIKEFKVTLNL